MWEEVVKMKKDYTEAQELRDKGLTLVEISKRTGINRDSISRNTVKRIKKKAKAPKEGNQDKLGKGVAKVHRNQRVYTTLDNRDEGKRKVVINKNTYIYTSKNIPDDIIIENFKKKYGIF